MFDFYMESLQETHQEFLKLEKKINMNQDQEL